MPTHPVPQEPARVARRRESRPRTAPRAAPTVARPRRPEPQRHPVVFAPDLVDPDVRKVVGRLVGYGYEAYLVGGCVRDLLLGHQPKDFDVATSARPEQIRALFRNSRIIGRRFRLVHVLLRWPKVIEVATFRRTPEEEEDRAEQSRESLPIRSDNVFGEAHEDARRRDFGINGLFYDLEREQVLDWVGGMQDIAERVVRTIGEPEARLREDPVRVLRAVKFAGRLGLGIAPELYDAMVCCRDALRLAARPRVAEEVLRLLRGGGARRSVYLAWQTGVLALLLPELAALLGEARGEGGAAGRVWRHLAYVDGRQRLGATLDDTVLWTLLLLEPMKRAGAAAADPDAAVAVLLQAQVERVAIARRCTDGMRRIVAALPRLQAGRPGRLGRWPGLSLALDVAEADLLAAGLCARPVAELRRGGRP
ncbi:MAG: polynucleotide adenylyltransferase PcnB [Deltaproteobacteria bacterium]|nr:polynucleotide adenylyltransferase PcnB [Deltaproteobacteria bacterium]